MIIKEIRLIRQALSRTEFIIQLAEEANELAIAALNMKNAIIHNYSNDVLNELEYDIIEEIADVKISIDIIGDYLSEINHSRPNNDDTLFIDNKVLFDLLAKHCCELSKAAIKYRRTLVPDASPTPVTEKEAEQKLIDEIKKVKLYIDYINSNYWNSDTVAHIYRKKANRCIDRMNIVINQ